MLCAGYWYYLTRVLYGTKRYRFAGTINTPWAPAYILAYLLLELVYRRILCNKPLFNPQYVQVKTCSNDAFDHD